MKSTTNKYVAVAATTVIACVIFSSLSRGESTTQARQRWEYVTETTNSHLFGPVALNERGKDGWELAGTLSNSTTFGYVFKRPLSGR